MMKKALIVASFWGHEKHIGNLRVDRFVRWLVEDGYYVCIVRAGSVDGQKDTVFGQVITIRDPLGLYRDREPSETATSFARKPNKLRRKLAYRLFCPDPEIVWGWRVSRSRKVAEALDDANFILSSNPPESAHLTAWKLSRTFDVPHIVDMRDGWIDEPLKPLLRSSTFRRWQEGRLERRIIEDAAYVYVTSEKWQELLCKRFQNIREKIIVLTNGYPLLKVPTNSQIEKSANNIKIIHAGRFLGSRDSQNPEFLLKKLLEFIEIVESRGEIEFIGDLSSEDYSLIEPFTFKIKNLGWNFIVKKSISRDLLFKIFSSSSTSGFLLLCVSNASIPGKIFEYTLFKKPIFVVTERDSATWNMCKKLPQAFLFDIISNNNREDFERFYQAIISKDFVGIAPEEYSEKYLAQVMLNAVRKI
ncbi:MAG: glycosyltransferase [bacterium]|nr:glycosyltransferase [bacterium]